ncbi:MAG: ABC transporter permease [Peptostreptococcaceae bacterium]|nr:ABC transporter permease [Peptostreptococcaceae bacterium]
MNFHDILFMGLKNLLRRKTRSILAITGVIIGTAAITVMISLGIGLREGFENQIKNWGNLHMIEVSPGGMYQEAPGKKKKEAKLTDKTIKELEKLPYVTAITPEIQTHMKLVIGRYITSANIVGVKPEVFEKFNLKLEGGRYLTKNDKMGILFGKNVAKWFHNPYSNTFRMEEDKLPVEVINARVKITADRNYGERFKDNDRTTQDGKTINYSLIEGKGIGLLESENDEYSYSAIMNIEDVRELIKQKDKDEGRNDLSRSSNEYHQAKVYVENTEKVKDVAKTLKDRGYMTFSLVDMLEEVKQMSNIVQAVLGGIGAVSLLVAALGITNTMIMSIYERTKEIGIMKVIGANIKDIRKLFLIEAASIGFFGGLIGLLISYGLSALANLLLTDLFMQGMYLDPDVGMSGISIIPWYLALGSLSFSTAVGILAGYLPANRAMKLSALESLRNE